MILVCHEKPDLMMSRQFNLLVTDDDLAAIEAKLRARGDVLFLSSNTNEARDALLPLESLRMADAPAGPTRQLAYLAPAQRPLRVKIEPVSTVKVHVSVEASEIIEFWRSYCARGQIQPNRMYYTAHYDDDAGYHDKDPQFVRWAESVVASIKKTLRYSKPLMAQIGRDAAAKIESGELQVIP